MNTCFEFKKFVKGMTQPHSHDSVNFLQPTQNDSQFTHRIAHQKNENGLIDKPLNE